MWKGEEGIGERLNCFFLLSFFSLGEGARNEHNHEEWTCMTH